MQNLVSNTGLQFIILNQKGKKAIIQFLASGSIREVNIDNAKAGKVKDLYYPSCYGVGYIGDVVITPYYQQAKQLWQNILKRCYSEKDPKGYKGEVIVEARWLCFANFLADLPNIPNFEKWIRGGFGGEKYQLDKDVLSGESKIYSRLTCQFITEKENKSLGKKGKKLVITDGIKKWVTPNECSLT